MKTEIYYFTGTGNSLAGLIALRGGTLSAGYGIHMPQNASGSFDRREYLYSGHEPHGRRSAGKCFLSTIFTGIQMLR